MAKKKTRGTPRRAARKPARKPSTALVRRPSAAPALKAKRVELLAPEPESRTITEGITLGALGLVEVKLTEAEEAILNEPVPVDRIQIKPTGQPYLSHPGYTRWFNRAFGRMGWALVPAGKPALSGKSVVCPYVLHIHGQPAAFAMGEQEYHENNKEQTYGDALEATIASALRRCAKRLGVGLELWDRAWLNEYLREYAVRVKVETAKRGQPSEPKRLWRLRSDPPFWNEIRTGGNASRNDEDEGGGTYDRPPSGSQRHEAAAGHGHSNAAAGERITQPQKGRLWKIVQNSGRDPESVDAWLLSRFGYKSREEILRRDYDKICTSVESTLDLPDRG